MAHRQFVNYEVYFFADEKGKARFARNPQPLCGRVTDPIIRTRFQPIASSPMADYMGRRYYFLTQGNRDIFLAHPDSFAVRSGM